MKQKTDVINDLEKGRKIDGWIRWIVGGKISIQLALGLDSFRVMYIYIYIYSFPELSATRDWSLTKVPPLCSRAKADFVPLLPRCSPMLPRCSPMLPRCSPMLPFCSPVLSLSPFLLPSCSLSLLRPYKFNRQASFSLYWILIREKSVMASSTFNHVMFCSFSLALSFISFACDNSSVYRTRHCLRSHIIPSFSLRSIRLSGQGIFVLL